MIRALPALLLIMIFLPWAVWAYETEDCIKCHGEESAKSSLLISFKAFQRSVHGGEISCQDCHTAITDEAHEDQRGSGKVICAACHEQENLHGAGSNSETRPQCHSCHGKHDILGKELEASRIHSSRLRQTCKSCHPLESGQKDVISWLPSLQVKSHKKQDFSGSYESGDCLGCHQGQAAHGEKDPLNEQNCYLCHLKMKGGGPVMGYIHAKADLETQPAIFFVAILYQIVILLLLCGGFRYFIRKFSWKKEKRED